MNILMSDFNYSNNLMIRSRGLVWFFYFNMYATEHFVELNKMCFWSSEIKIATLFLWPSSLSIPVQEAKTSLPLTTVIEEE